MKRLLMVGLIAIGSVYADIVPQLVNVNPASSRCGFDAMANQVLCSYDYTASLDDDAMLTGDKPFEEFFTIYDFNGYVDQSAKAPTGWEAITIDTGWTPPNVTPDDDPGITNLTFRYTGGTNILGGISLGTFSAKSVNGPTTILDYYSSQTTMGGGAAAGLPMQNIGWVAVPSPSDFPGNDVATPEPMSLSLFGGGLLALGLLRHRKKKA